MITNIYTTVDTLKARLDKMAEEFNGTKADTTKKAKDDTAYRKAFFDHLHTGMPTNELKEGSDGAGGYLVPDSYDKELVQALSEKSILRGLATTISTTHRLKIPTVNSHAAASWVQEGGSFDFGDETFGQIVIDAYKLGDAILVSDEMLEDSGMELESYIKESFGERLGIAEEYAFFNGDGNGKPTGIAYQADVARKVASIDELTLDDMIDLYYSVKTPYRKNAVYIMSTDAYLRLRKIKTYNGRPAWTSNLNDNTPDQLLGTPVYVTDALNSEDPEANLCDTPVLYGDFSYLWIAERGKRTMKRLVERFADRGFVGYTVTERVDAKLMLPEAVKCIKLESK